LVVIGEPPGGSEIDVRKAILTQQQQSKAALGGGSGSEFKLQLAFHVHAAETAS
jgi:hypothetical protein